MATVLNIPINRNEAVTTSRPVVNFRPGKIIFISWFASLITPVTVLLEILSRGF